MRTKLCAFHLELQVKKTNVWWRGLNVLMNLRSWFCTCRITEVDEWRNGPIWRNNNESRMQVSIQLLDLLIHLMNLIAFGLINNEDVALVYIFCFTEFGLKTGNCFDQQVIQIATSRLVYLTQYFIKSTPYCLILEDARPCFTVTVSARTTTTLSWKTVLFVHCKIRLEVLMIHHFGKYVVLKFMSYMLFT